MSRVPKPYDCTRVTTVLSYPDGSFEKFRVLLRMGSSSDSSALRASPHAVL